ncbi:MAG: hypothetical protein FGM14_05905 [Flavobacteriales bacterium]|nr:hypothetical protein [Flavobacteriales bacterium]
MVYNLTYSTSILESLGVLSSFNFAESIWEKYEKFAIPKIKESTIKLRGSIFYLKDLTPIKASKEANSIGSLIPVLAKLRTVIEPINDKEFKEFKIAALDFFETVDFLYANLQEIADIHTTYELSKPVLAADWDAVEDEHWDNY